jgi:predicted metal-dependent phosphoesterase TrpH
MRRVDLHVHSNASDGEHAPADVARRAARAGLAAIALTDHDTIAGVPDATREAGVHDLRVIAGCEFSVKARWGEMHMLAYFLPIADPQLTAFLTLQQQMRSDRMVAIVKRLGAAGVAVSFDDIRAVAGTAALGRPHAARALIKLGAVKDVGGAFQRYLGQGRPAFVDKVLPSVAETTSLVRQLGGVSSAAHLKWRAGVAVLRELHELGVDAVEARHPAHDEALSGRIELLAREQGMLVSGGSDWHGDARQGDPDRAPLGGIPVPYEWLTAVEQLHQQRRPAEATA